MNGLKADLKSLQQVFALMDEKRKESFAKAFDSEYPDVAKWVRENGIPKTVMVPDGYVANAESIEPLLLMFQNQWGIKIVRTQLIREAKIYLIADDKIKIGVDLS